MGRLIRSRSIYEDSEKGSNYSDDDVIDIQFSGSCPSVSVILPLLHSVDVGDLYHRCGQEIRTATLSRGHLGFLFEEVCIQKKSVAAGSVDVANSQQSNTRSVSASCHRLILCVSSPSLSVLSVGTCMQRLDIIALVGRLEVDPVIPVSLEIRSQQSGDGMFQQHARDSFPVVPSISSFKARQADEDEDEHIAEVLLSNLKDLQVDSRKSLRGSDPQVTMLDEAERCRAVIRLHIPEVWCDLCTSELSTFLRMLKATQPSKKQAVAEASIRSNLMDEAKVALNGIAIGVDQATISIHDSCNGLDNHRPQSEKYSFGLVVDGLKAHAVLGDKGLRQARLISHDFCLYYSKSYAFFQCELFLIRE